MSASKVTATLAEQDYHLQEMEKTDIIEDENVKIHDGLADLSALELESRFAHLNRKETIRTFWKVTLYACMVGLGALFDGYAIVGALHPTSRRCDLTDFSSWLYCRKHRFHCYVRHTEERGGKYCHGCSGCWRMGWGTVRWPDLRHVDWAIYRG